MSKTIAMLVTSITGNTAKLADAVEQELKQQGHIVKRYDNAEALHAVDRSNPLSADLYMVFFWCRKSTLNDQAQKMVKAIRCQNVIAFGTMGSYPTGEYGDLVRANVENFINESGNTCTGVYLSQGAIKPERTEKRRALPKDAPHYLDDEGYKRHLESRKHPDQNDIEGAVTFAVSKAAMG